jgi:PAS domain S-box-containing protein
MAAIVVLVATITVVLAYLEVRRQLMTVAVERLNHLSAQLQDMFAVSARQSFAAMTALTTKEPFHAYLASPGNTSDSVAVALLQSQSRSASVRAIELWDANGGSRLASKAAVPLDATTRSALISAVAANPTGFVSAYRPIADTLESSIIVPVRRDSTVIGFLVQRRRLAETPQSVRNLTELMGENARLMIGSRSGDVWTDLVSVVSGIPQAMTADTNVIVWQRTSGERVLTRARPVPATDWLIAVEFLEGPIIAPAARFAERALVVALLLSLVGALIGLVVSRKITAPLQEMTRAATALASGVDSTRVTVTGNDELGQLATAFNAMAEKLERAHSRLAGALERYRLLFDRNPFPMWVYDRQSLAFIEVNEAAVQHYGYSRDEFLAMTLGDIRPSEEIPQLLAAVAEPADGPTRVGQWKHRRKDGSIIDVEIARTDVQLQGKSASFALAHDVTNRLAAEHALAHSRQRIELQLGRLNALRAIDLAILGTTDLRLLLRSVQQEVMSQLHSDAVVIYLSNPHSLTVDTSASVGFRTRAAERMRMRVGDGVSGKAARERRTIAVPDLSAIEMSDQLRQIAADEGIRSVYAVPLIAKGQVIGVLEVLFRTPHNASEDWLEFCEALAGQAAMAIESCKSFEDLQRTNLELSLAYDRTIEGWSRALDLRDKETEGHTQRVTDMTLRLGKLAGISDSELVHVRRGALLHDIGKMGVPDAILHKPGPLTDDEWKIMRLHTTFAIELLSAVEYLRPALDIPFCHHEKWDGSGYPRGLKGDQIPFVARLFSVVDVWDALRSDRPYRDGWEDAQVLTYIREQGGSHFDPRAVELFLRLLAESGNEVSPASELEHVRTTL